MLADLHDLISSVDTMVNKVTGIKKYHFFLFIMNRKRHRQLRTLTWVC